MIGRIDPSLMKAAGLGAATTAIGQQARPSTEFDSVSMTLNMAQEVATRAVILADRLLGAQPQEGSNGSISESPDGVLPRMAMQAHYTRSRLSDAMAAFERIERALP